MNLPMRDYDPDRDAPVILGWVRTEKELLHVAPSSVGPLTVDDVRQWVRPGGRAYVLAIEEGDAPIAYGEVMPLQGKSTHCWLGHVIIDPAYRGRGMGADWTRRLIRRAFDDSQIANVSLVVFPDNPAAIAAYQRAGMIVTGEELHTFGQPARMHKLIRLEVTRDDMR